MLKGVITFATYIIAIQRKQAMLKPVKIHETLRGKFTGHWESASCMTEKYSLISLDNRNMVKESFNLNFESKCQIT